jgi:DNA-binding transcriptional ArsR family regulator
VAPAVCDIGTGGILVLRVHFTPADLLRTRVSATCDPFWEMVFSRHRLAEYAPPAVLRPWVARVRSDPGRLEPGERVLGALAPRGPYFPDFITPPEGVHGLEAGMDAILGTPRRRLNQEVGRLARWSSVPSWGQRLADGHVATLTQVTAFLRAYHAVAIEPYSGLIRAVVEAEHLRRKQDARTGGVEGLLRGMAPLMRWCPPVLEMPYRVDRDLHLAGRGLLLVPSFFCRNTPVALADPDLPPTLLYPADPRSHWQAAGKRSLVALLGATRAMVFAAIDGGATTSELARRIGTSPGSVSRHTQVLREAGLIETVRCGNAVVHTLTQLGTSLLLANSGIT